MLTCLIENTVTTVILLQILLNIVFKLNIFSNVIYSSLHCHMILQKVFLCANMVLKKYFIL